MVQIATEKNRVRPRPLSAAGSRPDPCSALGRGPNGGNRAPPHAWVCQACPGGAAPPARASSWRSRPFRSASDAGYPPMVSSATCSWTPRSGSSSRTTASQLPASGCPQPTGPQSSNTTCLPDRNKSLRTRRGSFAGRFLVSRLFDAACASFQLRPALRAKHSAPGPVSSAEQRELGQVSIPPR